MVDGDREQASSLALKLGLRWGAVQPVNHASQTDNCDDEGKVRTQEADDHGRDSKPEQREYRAVRGEVRPGVGPVECK